MSSLWFETLPLPARAKVDAPEQLFGRLEQDNRRFGPY
jgi:hypothetical protein